MTSRSLSILRNSAAALITLSGLGLITLLWFRELNEPAVAEALLGTVYLIIGLGLLGQSRFTLFVAIAAPAMGAALLLQSTPLPELNSLQLARVAADALVILFCTIVLWQVRSNPSV